MLMRLLVGSRRRRPWIAALVTVAVVATASAGVAAAAPEEEYAVSRSLLCVKNGSEELPAFYADFVVTLKATGPTSVEPGQEFSMHEASAAITLPVEVVESFIARGGVEVSGSLTQLERAGDNFGSGSNSSSNVSPFELNIAKPAEFPEGLPFHASLVAGQPLTFAIPSLTAGESGRTFSFRPQTVIGDAGEEVRLEVQSTEGFEAQPAGTTGTGIGIISVWKINGVKRFAKFGVACNVPPSMVLAEIPIVKQQAQPTVTKVEPDQGPMSGGTAVTVTGTNLNGATSVKFGSTPATGVKVVSESEITAVAPPGTGTADVTVVTPGGTSATGTADEFTYLPPRPWKPSVPARGPRLVARPSRSRVAASSPVQP